jgi:hypothetical protein
LTLESRKKKKEEPHQMTIWEWMCIRNET